MGCSRRDYNVPPRVGSMLVSNRLHDIDNPPTGWYIFHFEAFKIGLRFPVPCLIVYMLSTFDVNLTQINPNVWKTLLCVSIITGELGIELNDKKTKAMYYLKKNDLDKERTYISVISGGELILKLPTSRGR